MLSSSVRRLAMSSGMPLGLQVLFTPKTFAISEVELTRELRAFDPSLNEATVSLQPDGEEGVLGVCRWTDPKTFKRVLNHRVDVIARNNCPLPSSVAEACVTYAAYGEDVKAVAKAAQSTVYLTYHIGEDRVPPLEQYTALCAVTGALCRFGAAGVVNVNSCTSAPPKLFDKRVIEARMNSPHTLNFFRALPFLTLYCGFSPFRPGDKPGFGFRTHGAQHIALPNLAAFSQELQPAADTVVRSFQGLWETMLSQGRTLEEGHSLQLTEDPDSRIVARRPTETETYLRDPSENVLVLDPVKSWEHIYLPGGR